MCAFVSSFAPAALITTIKDDLKLSKVQETWPLGRSRVVRRAFANPHSI
jgi:hypothetical protein